VRKFEHRWNGMLRDSEVNVPRIHPNQKPVALARWCFERYLAPGRRVFDPCAGSGITVIAATELRLEQSVYAMEISPAYCDHVLQRWENVTGKVSVRRAGGHA
jgi:DNA modification methylase